MNNKNNSPSHYCWEGINRKGEKIKGKIEANSILLAKIELGKQGIITQKILKQRRSLFDKSNKKISQADIAIFSRQISTMIKAGIPLIQSFNIIIKGHHKQRMKYLLETIQKDIEAGLTFAESLGKHPVFFNKLYCNLIDAGEKSGTLATMLDKVTTYKERIETIKKKIKNTLTYPITVLTIAFLVTAALLIFVIPQFEALFSAFGADLPPLTRGIISLSEFFKSYWLLLFTAIGGIIYGFLYARSHSSQFAQSFDRIMLKCPFIGSIFREAAIARFARTLSITFAAGLPLVDALNAVAGATGHTVYANATNKMKEEIVTGQQIHLAMENTQLFPNLVVQMVAIGEESGTLEQMLSKIADYYEVEVDNAVDTLNNLLEPIIMSILGILVGCLVIAMYIPVFKLGSAV